MEELSLNLVTLKERKWHTLAKLEEHILSINVRVEDTQKVSCFNLWLQENNFGSLLSNSKGTKKRRNVVLKESSHLSDALLLQKLFMIQTKTLLD
jgi:hypothetical protein